MYKRQILIDGQKVHPTFLYESVWCLFLFFVLSAVDKRRKFKGQVALLYGVLYSFERFFVEQLRTDSLLTCLLYTSCSAILPIFSLRRRAPDFSTANSV